MLGDKRLEAIADMICKEYGYLCFNSRNISEAIPLIASELAILETYNFLVKESGEVNEHSHRAILTCLNDDKCLDAMVDMINNVVDIYINNENYFLSINKEELQKTIKIAEKVASEIENRTKRSNRVNES